MKVIEMGNCLENKEPGIIISATKEELNKIRGNLLYDDVEVIRTDICNCLRIISESYGVKLLNELLKESNMKSFTLNDIDYYTQIAKQMIKGSEVKK